MPNPSSLQRVEFTPEDAFLCAFDEAVGITIKCLVAAGVDDETMWSAFRKAVAYMNERTTDVQSAGFPSKAYVMAMATTEAEHPSPAAPTLRRNRARKTVAFDISAHS